MQLMISSCKIMRTKSWVQEVNNEYENTDSEIDEKDLHEIDKLSLDDSNKEWCKCEFESKLKDIYDMRRLNDMNCIHDNK